MSLEAYNPSKLFTVEQANAALPYVRAIVTDVMRLSQSMIERRQRLDHLTAGRDMESGDPYHDELAQIEDELEKDSGQLQEYIQELTQLGVEPKSLPDGLVDFPSEMDGRIVYLCWRYDEPDVQFWHELAAGFSGRQSLAAPVGADEPHNDHSKHDLP